MYYYYYYKLDALHVANQHHQNTEWHICTGKCTRIYMQFLILSHHTLSECCRKIMLYHFSRSNSDWILSCRWFWQCPVQFRAREVSRSPPADHWQRSFGHASQHTDDTDERSQYALSDNVTTNVTNVLMSRLGDWCLTALSALTGYIMPQEYKMYHVWPHNKINTQ